MRVVIGTERSIDALTKRHGTQVPYDNCTRGQGRCSALASK
jgi:hypothetical protein